MAYESITTIDAQYMGPGRAAVYLIEQEGRAAFVDNNTARALPLFLEALSARGLSPEQVEYLIVTHVHLDHAGGTGALLERCPNATVLAHPKAAPHLIAPERLVASTMGVYGGDLFRDLYGEVAPVPEGRVRIMGDDETLDWRGRTLRFLHTRGHANHHFSIYDGGTNSVFTGDSFGIGRSEAVRPGPAFVFCTTSPTDFDADAARLSAQRIVATGAQRCWLGHFDYVDDPDALLPMLLASVDAHAGFMQAADAEGIADGDLVPWLREHIAAYADEHLRAAGVADFEADRHWLEGDILLNAMGLAWRVQRARKKTGS